MNGAQALIRTLVDSEVDVCFMNPGTSEMHFVHELDQVPGMRSVLALFEGVATGAADGYARMAGRPAAVLLHLGPGLGNGLANLHNARRAKTPVVNIVGDHATYHAKYDAPLQSDIASIAAGVSGWIRTATDPEHVARDDGRIDGPVHDERHTPIGRFGAQSRRQSITESEIRHRRAIRQASDDTDDGERRGHRERADHPANDARRGTWK